MSSFSYPTTYFFKEGKSNLRECLQVAFEAAKSHDIKTIVMFTGIGEGPEQAIQRYLELPEYAGIKLVAVTFPAGRVEAEISTERWALMRNRGIEIVRARLPFDPIEGTFQERGVGQGLALLGSVLEAFCGSMSLCVQAALMACDAGAVGIGEHVISVTSDTAIVAQVCDTQHFLTHFIVREILCKPVLLTIAKGETKQVEQTTETLADLERKLVDSRPVRRELPEGTRRNKKSK